VKVLSQGDYEALIKIGTLGQFTWRPLLGDFKLSISRIKTAGAEIDKIAQIEHMHQTHKTRIGASLKL
jgi:hypothetical protein